MKYTKLENNMIRNNETGAFIPADPLNSDYMDYLAWANTNSVNIEEKVVSLEEAKAAKIYSLKAMASALLSQTDWYVIRSQETLKNIPPEIVNIRKAVRAYATKAESEISLLKTKAMVDSYVFKFPTM